MKKALAPAILETPRMSGEPIGPEHEAEIAELSSTRASTAVVAVG